MMFAFATMISRLVPLLLVVSACLIVARFARDRLSTRSQPLARTIFTTIVATTAALSVFVMVQAGCLAMARLTSRRDAATLDKWYRAYVAMHGRITPPIAFDWAMAFMVQGRWTDARALLLQTGTPSPQGPRFNADAVLLIGETFFYAGDLDRAEQALTVARKTTRPFLRSYLLGRIAGARGNTAAALELLAASLRSNSQFFPAFYHRQRLLMMLGQFDRAEMEIKTMRKHVETRGNDQWQVLERALATRTVPPEVEFYVVEV